MVTEYPTIAGRPVHVEPLARRPKCFYEMVLPFTNSIACLATCRGALVRALVLGRPHSALVQVTDFVLQAFQ